jgi:hypothetical protein
MARIRAAHVVRGVAGVDAVDADVVRAPLDRELPAQLIDAALRGAVGGEPAEADQAASRGGFNVPSSTERETATAEAE